MDGVDNADVAFGTGKEELEWTKTHLHFFISRLRRRHRRTTSLNLNLDASNSRHQLGDTP